GADRAAADGRAQGAPGERARAEPDPGAVPGPAGLTTRNPGRAMILGAILTDWQFKYLIDNIPMILMAAGTTFAAVMGWRNAASLGQVKEGVEGARGEAE